MKNLTYSLLSILLSTTLYAQKSDEGIKLIAKYSSENSEIRDILQIENIEYHKLSFVGKELKGKTYHLSVKEIWNGKIKNESTISNSAEMPIEQFKKITDTIFNVKVISKLTAKNKLKMTFEFPSYSVTKEYNAIESSDYSLRNVCENSKTEIVTGKKFYLLAYILPYEKDGAKYWCAVEDSGKGIENWGNEFGIKHYLVFEMIFQ